MIQSVLLETTPYTVLHEGEIIYRSTMKLTNLSQSSPARYERQRIVRSGLGDSIAE